MSRYLAFFAALALAFPARALADATGAPVVLNSCSLIYDSTNIASQITGLQAQFTNNGPKTAQTVNIKADFSGTSQIIRDVGTFSPGVEINHRYKQQTGQFALPAVIGNALSGRPNVVCTISSVVWDDGTTWVAPAVAIAPGGTAPASAPANPSAITATPNTMFLRGIGTANARLFFATGGGPLALSSDCGKVANVKILATTAHDIAVSVTPKARGACALTVHDANDNFATIPVRISGAER